MNNMNLKRLAFALAVVACAFLVLGAAATRNRYVGVFVGDGSLTTNIAVTSVGGGLGTAAYSNASAFYGTVASNQFHGAFTGNAAGLTNVSVTSTNALYATNDPAGAALSMVSKLDVTNASVANTLLVTGIANQDPRIFIARGSAVQSTNNLIEAQNTAQTVLFSVSAGGAVAIASNTVASWPTAPKYGGNAVLVNSNGVVYLLTSGAGLTWTATNKLGP